MVAIFDPELNADVCAAVYQYANTVIELGRGEFRVNGHLWRSYSPLVPDGYEVIRDFTPADYETPEDISKLLAPEAKPFYVWVEIDGQEPASKLFTILDWVEESNAGCWINFKDDKIKNSIRIYGTRASTIATGKGS